MRSILRTTFQWAALACSAGAFAAPVLFSTPGTDRALAVAVDPATSEVYVAGSAWTGPASGNDMYVVKYTPTGIPLWKQVFGGTGIDAVADIAIRGANIYITGTFQNGATPTNCATLRLDPAGNILNVQMISTALADGGKFIRIDGGGNVYVGGYVGNGGTRDFLLAKYTPALAGVFVNAWGSPIGADEPNSMAISANGVYLAGKTTNAAGDYDGMAARFSAVTGAFIFARFMSGGAGLDDMFNDIAIDAAGQVYLAGTLTTAAAGEQVRLLKYNAALAFNIWANTINYSPANGDDRPNRIRLTPMGLMVGGRSWAPIGVGYDAFVTLVSPATGAAGGPWLFNRIDHDEVLDLVQGIGGETYVLMATDGPVGHDYGTARLNGGALAWVDFYNWMNHDEPVKMAMTPAGRPVVIGASENGAMGFDWASLCYNTNGTPFW